MSTYGYKDNYPHNIEAPQRVNFQYSHDIEFDYSTGKYPLGETHEGFLWENIYIPVEHYIGDTLVGKHVWMRTSVGLNGDWTAPIRLTDSFTNIDSTEIEYDTTNGTAIFKIKYTLADGTIIYSEPIVIQNGIDGRGISGSAISGDNLILSYTDGTTENVGRVVGYNGLGVPIGTTDYNYLVSIDDIPQWRVPIEMLNDNLSGTLPIDYTNGVISHILTDGNRHIPIGGTLGDSLLTDGDGNYFWDSHILLSNLDDNAGAGDIDKIYSADHITTLLGGISAFGIKYSEETKVLLDLIIAEDNELGVVTNDPLWPNRTVFQWSGGAGGNWGSGFFDLDALHNHDDDYYTKSETNVLLDAVNWTAVGDSGSIAILNGNSLDIVGGTGVTTSIAGNVLTINAEGAAYTAGIGLDLIGTEFRHEDTSTLSSITYTGGIVLQGVSVDGFGHLTGLSTINLDLRFGQSHYSGDGLTGAPYNGSGSVSWHVDYAGSGGDYGIADTVARSDHSHAGSGLSSVVVEIGPWDMNGTASINVAHGLGLVYFSVVSISVGIRSDTLAGFHLPLNYPDSVNNLPSGKWYANGTNIVLTRDSAGYFNNTSFNDTGFSRGWITIWYTN